MSTSCNQIIVILLMVIRYSPTLVLLGVLCQSIFVEELAANAAVIFAVASHLMKNINGQLAAK